MNLHMQRNEMQSMLGFPTALQPAGAAVMTLSFYCAAICQMPDYSWQGLVDKLGSC